MKYLAEPRSGSLQGTTYGRNRFGQYTRSRATPVNPNTSAQGTVRARLSANAAAWRTLTDAQRAGWASLGSMIQRTDSLGQQYTLNGFMAYCSVNNNLEGIGSARVSDAPELVTPPAILTAALTLTSAAFSIAFTPTPLGAGAHLQVFASPQQSAGRTFNGDFRFIALGAAATASPLNVLAAYTAKFGVPVTGNKIFISASVQVGGFSSGPLITGQIVA
jgi:hypothetical protein